MARGASAQILWYTALSSTFWHVAKTGGANAPLLGRIGNLEHGTEVLSAIDAVVVRGAGHAPPSRRCLAHQHGDQLVPGGAREDDGAVLGSQEDRAAIIVVRGSRALLLQQPTPSSYSRQGRQGVGRVLRNDGVLLDDGAGLVAGRVWGPSRRGAEGARPAHACAFLRGRR